MGDSQVVRALVNAMGERPFADSPAIHEIINKLLKQAKRGQYSDAYGIRTFRPMMELAARKLYGAAARKTATKKMIDAAASQAARSIIASYAKEKPKAVERSMGPRERRILRQIHNQAAKVYSMTYKGPQNAAAKDLADLVEQAAKLNISRSAVNAAIADGRKAGEQKLAERRDAVQRKTDELADKRFKSASRKRKTVDADVIRTGFSGVLPIPTIDEEPTNRERHAGLRAWRARQAAFDEEPTGRFTRRVSDEEPTAPFIRPAPRPRIADVPRVPEERTLPLSNREVDDLTITEQTVLDKTGQIPLSAMARLRRMAAQEEERTDRMGEERTPYLPRLTRHRARMSALHD